MLNSRLAGLAFSSFLVGLKVEQFGQERGKHMTYTITTVPEPERVKKFVGFEIAYKGRPMYLECVGLSLVHIFDSELYPDVDCLYARVAQKKIDENLYETWLYLVPLEYVTKVEMIALPKAARFVSTPTQMLIALDSPPAKNRMKPQRIKDLLCEFGVETK